MPRMPKRFQAQLGLVPTGSLDSTGAPVSIRRRTRSPVVRKILLALAAAVLTATPAAAFAKPAGKGPKETPAMEGCTTQDTLATGQQRIDQGQYEEAVRVFSCVMAADGGEVDAYRGRAEAELLLGRYADAYS